MSARHGIPNVHVHLPKPERSATGAGQQRPRPPTRRRTALELRRRRQLWWVNEELQDAQDDLVYPALELLRTTLLALDKLADPLGAPSDSPADE